MLGNKYKLRYDKSISLNFDTLVGIFVQIEEVRDVKFKYF